MEPYPTPNLITQDLAQILKAVNFVDKIIFGRTNYNKEATAYKNHKMFYNEKARQGIDYCLEKGIEYYIKEKTITNI